MVLDVCLDEANIAAVSLYPVRSNIVRGLAIVPRSGMSWSLLRFGEKDRYILRDHGRLCEHCSTAHGQDRYHDLGQRKRFVRMICTTRPPVCMAPEILLATPVKSSHSDRQRLGVPHCHQKQDGKVGDCFTDLRTSEWSLKIW